jgi:hypothetical protein
MGAWAMLLQKAEPVRFPRVMTTQMENVVEMLEHLSRLAFVSVLKLL